MSKTYSISIDPTDQCEVQAIYREWSGASVNGVHVHAVISSELPSSIGTTFIDGVVRDMTLSFVPEELFLELDAKGIKYKIL